MACSIVAKKMDIKVIHVEGGIRSWDLTMPEEINRMVTDSITDYFFTTSETANNNLMNNGILKDRIFYVGNTMIDTLLKHRQNFIKPPLWDKVGLEENNYIVMTLHRPANVDEERILKELMDEIIAHSCGVPIIFPVHPRTAKQLESLGISYPNFHAVEPLSYLEFNYLVERAKAVITDSGGITEETTVMNIPCMTLRDNTERPETIELGTNELLGVNPKAIGPAMDNLFTGNWKKGQIPHLWDGKTSERIVNHLLNFS
jgi:UDP-N-acetylglucosamine 2-epimerase (non-hydrolysing)